MILLNQMILFFIMMIIGFVCAKKDKLDPVTSKKVSWIVLNVANPGLILSGAASNTGLSTNEVIFIVAVAFGLYIAMILVAFLLSFLFGKKKEEITIYRLILIFSNMGFLGLPLMSAVYGKESLIYLSIFLIPFNLFIYTYGIWELQRTEKQESTTKQNPLKKLINIGFLTSILALVITLFGWKIPETLAKFFDMLGNLTGPLSMMVIGASFTEMNLKSVLGDWKVYLYSFLKLIAMPLVGILILRLFIDNTFLLGAAFMVLATPGGSMNVLLCKQYRNDDTIPAKGVALSTLLAVATMPLIMLILGL